MVPERLTDWTYEAIEQLCAAGQSESDRHDFKRSLPDVSELTKICCAFANTFGGFVILGVRQSGGRWQPLGVAPGTEYYADFKKKVRSEPDIPIEPSRIVSIPGGDNQIHVFEIPQSTRRPHLPLQEESRAFWKRIGPSCVRMSLEEVRSQMISEQEQRDKLSLLLIELQNDLRSVEETANLRLGAWDGTIYNFEIINRAIVEAYPLLKSDLHNIKRLDAFKRRLMTLNAHKQTLIAVMANSYDPTYKAQVAEQHAGVARDMLPMLSVAEEQIRQSLQQIGVTFPI